MRFIFSILLLATLLQASFQAVEPEAAPAAVTEGKVVEQVAIPVVVSHDSSEEEAPTETDTSHRGPILSPPVEDFASKLPENHLDSPVLPAIFNSVDLREDFKGLASTLLEKAETIIPSLLDQPKSSLNNLVKSMETVLQTSTRIMQDEMARKAPRVVDAEFKAPEATVTIYNHGTAYKVEHHAHEKNGYACHKVEVFNPRGIDKNALIREVPKDIWPQVEQVLDKFQAERDAAQKKQHDEVAAHEEEVHAETVEEHAEAVEEPSEAVEVHSDAVEEAGSTTESPAADSEGSLKPKDVQ